MVTVRVRVRVTFRIKIRCTIKIRLRVRIRLRIGVRIGVRVRVKPWGQEWSKGYLSGLVFCSCTKILSEHFRGQRNASLETIIKGSTYNCSSGGLSWKTLDSITFGGVLNVWTLMIGPLELIGMDPNSISPSIFTSDPGRVYYDTEQIEILVT